MFGRLCLVDCGLVDCGLVDCGLVDCGLVDGNICSTTQPWTLLFLSHSCPSCEDLQSVPDWKFV